MSDTAHDDGAGAPPTQGRRIVLQPTPPGLWAILLGVSLAALAPLGGFLVGGAIGTADSQAANDPMFIALFIGIVIGGIGVLIAILGGVRLWRHQHRTDVAQEEAERRRAAPAVSEGPAGEPPR